MSNNNPYAAPRTSLTDTIDNSVVADSSIELASRSRRFWAVMIDTLIMAPCGFFLAYYVFMPFLIGKSGLEAMRQFKQLDAMTLLDLQLLQFIPSLLIVMLINGRLLKKYGQTIGKRLLKIRIVNVDGSRATMTTILKRIGFQYSLGIIPKIASLICAVDCLLIFSADHRCLHDRVAGTIVVRAPSEAAIK